MWEVTKSFRFEAAHTLQRRQEVEASLRVHGHSYRARVTVRGRPDPDTGMLIDLGLFEACLAEVRADLDHRMLDEVVGLGPATLENLAAWIWRKLEPRLTGLVRVAVLRDSLDEECVYTGESN